jgi:hypothetical protein
MEVREDFALLESLLVELVPLTDGFASVLLEIYRNGDLYILRDSLRDR